MMSARTKQFVIKFLIVLGLCLLFLLFPGLIIMSFLVNEYILSIIYYTALFSFFAVGVILLICILAWGIDLKPTLAEKYTISFVAFSSFLEHININLTAHGFLQIPLSYTNSDLSIWLYKKRKPLWNSECFCVIRAEQLTSDAIASAESIITNALIAYEGTTSIDITNITLIFCVDRVSNSFKKMLNNNIKQTFKVRKLIVGVSFGSKSVYIARQKDGFAYLQYYRMRKFFLRIMNLTYIK